MRYFVTGVLVMLFGCSENKLKVDESPTALLTQVSDESATPDDPQKRPDTQVIKTAHYKFLVANVDTAMSHIHKIADRFAATISKMDQSATTHEVVTDVTIRVPARDFEALLASIGKDALYTNYKRIDALDVSEEFIDVRTRLQTKKEVRDRYIDILKNKAKTVDDVLKAETAIRTIQEEIEAKEGRLAYLMDRTAFSTIHLEMYQDVVIVNEPDHYTIPYSAELGDAFLNGWTMVKKVLIGVITIWPLMIVLAFFYWKRRWLQLRLKTR